MDALALQKGREAATELLGTTKVPWYARGAVEGLFILRARIAALETRTAELEAAQARTLADAFKGPHLAGKMYQRGDLVQRAGCTWLALLDTSARPGDSSDWRALGRDRDAR